MLAQLRTRGALPLQLAALVVAEMELKTHTAMQQCETHTPVAFRERENPLVILDAGGLKSLDSYPPGLSRFAFAATRRKACCARLEESSKRTHVIVEHGLHAHDVGDALGNGGMDVRRRHIQKPAGASICKASS